MDPERERERLAEQRARKWMWELVVPLATERRDAIGKLEAMAAGVEPEDRRASSVVATDRLSQVLANGELPGDEPQDVAVVLGLIGSETGVDALERLARKGEQPPELRRAALEALGLAAKRLGGKPSPLRERIVVLLEEQLRADALDLRVEGVEGWADHDRRLPVLQGASRGLQLAASAELPLLGSGPGRKMPMLTLTAIKGGEGLRIRTEVVTPPVWRLPLPEWPGEAPQQLELVVVPEDEYEIGSPEKEDGRKIYTQFRQKCEGVNVETLRQVSLKAYALVRHPISQAQWRAVAALPKLERDLSLSPGTYDAKGLWEIHAQPGGLAVDSVSSTDSQEWQKRLNRWLQEKWLALGGHGEPPVFGLVCRPMASPSHPRASATTAWLVGTGREARAGSGLMDVPLRAQIQSWRAIRSRRCGCCAAAPGSSILTSPARPCGAAIPWPETWDLWWVYPLVSSPFVENWRAFHILNWGITRSVRTPWQMAR